eukprot:CAMPEP_0201584444 /NCGR_PEP_ID=MMETSP0190_2-20130828/110680_1 /ASSEMBLY_ACC=CAM_ASM_000263 /TAXON_ID=37353 /ORGANISM="Rosalina sp." /LENGTH=117 /DNA_ID=CAMNT_0048028407 /DNA_START=1 /DNA_END=350 /DNA_ORIENTATION=+
MPTHNTHYDFRNHLGKEQEALVSRLQAEREHTKEDEDAYYKHNLRISPKSLKTSLKADLSMDNEIVKIDQGPTGDALLDQQDDKMDKQSSMIGGYEYIHAGDNIALNAEMILMTILA